MIQNTSSDKIDRLVLPVLPQFSAMVHMGFHMGRASGASCERQYLPEVRAPVETAPVEGAERDGPDE